MNCCASSLYALQSFEIIPLLCYISRYNFLIIYFFLQTLLVYLYRTTDGYNSLLIYRNCFTIENEATKNKSDFLRIQICFQENQV